MVDGKPVYRQEMAYPTEPGMTLGIYLYKFALGKGPYYRSMDSNWFTHLPEAIDAMYLWDGSTDGGTGDIADPFISMPVEEGEEYSAIVNDAQTYANEARVKFITGEWDIEEKWDEYVSTIEGMDIETAIEIKQGAVDRHNARYFSKLPDSLHVNCPLRRGGNTLPSALLSCRITQKHWGE